MRVFHFNLEKGWRGGERQTLLTAAEQRRQGVDSQIACRRGSTLEQMARAAGVPTIPLSAFVPGSLVGLARAIPSFDIVHCHTGRAHSLAVLAMLRHRKPTVVSRRVDFVPSHSWFNRWKFQRVDKVVCVSRCIGRILADWGLPSKQIDVVYEAVPGDTYLTPEVSRQQLCERTGVRREQKIIGNIAALVAHKDHETLLRAASLLVRRRPDAAFIIVGEGPLKERLLRRRDELNLAGAVHFTGFIPQAQRLLPGFDLLAMSSCMEGLGTTVLDAGMAGVPVAATAGGGLPEIVLHERTGLLVPVGDAPGLADALLRLLEDAPLAQRLARNARQRLEAEFTVAAMAGQFVKIYQSLLSRGA